MLSSKRFFNTYPRLIKFLAIFAIYGYNKADTQRKKDPAYGNDFCRSVAE